jgi:2-oxo-3-hexenedioate decarboxylase
VEPTASELLSLLGTGRQGRRYPGLDPARAYAIAERIRELRGLRGERPVGRKIGFTNRTIWLRYGVDAPMWNYLFDRTVHDLAEGAGRLDLAAFPEPRIEPEVVLHLDRAPEAGMSEAELLGCVDWVAPGFEIVQSVYPGWRFTLPEATAAFGLHGALLLGARRPVASDRAAWERALGSFAVALSRDGGAPVRGHATHVLGGPVKALAFLVEEIERHLPEARLRAGEIISTGTLTDAQPLGAGERWSAEFDGIAFEPLRLATRG